MKASRTGVMAIRLAAAGVGLGSAAVAAAAAGAHPAWGISDGDISPAELSASGQRVSVTYSGKDTLGPSSTLLVEQCVRDDSAAGFDPLVDCSPLSRQTFFAVASEGEVAYGGNPKANPYAPFVGVDPYNGAWSLCTPDSGIENHDGGFLRLADAPDDQGDDVFVAFGCASTTATQSSLPVALPVTGAGVACLTVAGLYARHRRSTAAHQTQSRSARKGDK